MSNPSHRGLDEAEAAEVEARKARLDDIKRAHAERNGVAHPDMAPADPGLAERALPAAGAVRTGRQLVLEAVARHYRPGDVVFPSRLAEQCGVNVAHVSVIIGKLRVKGEWPYAPCSQAVKPGSRPPRPVEPAPGPDLREPDPRPIRDGDPKADAELLVLQRVMSQLDRLPNATSRRRVLAYLIDREGEA